jgi:hypothetical protein
MRQKEIAEARSQKALEEKKRLDARTVEEVATESEERARKVVAGWQRKLRNWLLGELGPAECACKAMSASGLAFRGQTIVGRSVAN